MIKINKNLASIPESLKPPTTDFFVAPKRPRRPSKTTHKRRVAVIGNGAYIDKRKFNSRYRLGDVTESLDELYCKKCAFCEQRQETPHVEHFRPKHIYFWLAYSWDNLLYACTSCNSTKKNSFEISGTRATFLADPSNPFREIHNLCATHDKNELPMLVNPETEDLSHELIFNEDGEVHSNNTRLQHTIDKCGVSRDDLCYQRKKILDDFGKDIRRVLLVNSGDFDDQRVAIKTLVEQFIDRSNSSYESFLAFRRYAIQNDFLGSIIKQIT